MPQLQKRGDVRSEELLEYPITGPFGGCQSELPVTEIDDYGFFDSRNIMFRKGAAYVRPGYTALAALPAPANEPILGLADFFTSNAARVQVVFTPTRLLQWNAGPGTFTNVPGTGLTGANTDLFAWDVVGQRICFSQGVDKIRSWDGIAGAFVTTSVNAPAARHIAEIDLHLMTGDTVEGGVRFPQRYRWSGAGDPTDWISFNAGANDNLNNLGPINGICKLGQYGYGFHHWGIVQIIPTGVGVSPFAFECIVSADLGNIAPSTLDHFNRDGVEQAIYVGEDNVYLFNQASIIPVGDRPIDGNKRIGARTRIFADLVASTPGSAYGYVTHSIAGNIFNGYWLIIPGVRIWVLNFDEMNWTPFDYDKTWVTVGSFFKNGVPRIIDLVGTIQAQGWTPANLVASVPFDGMAFGSNAGVVGYVDFTNSSEMPWQIVSGLSTFKDRRHKHSVKKFRLAVLDLGAVSYTVTITNEYGQTESQTATIVTGTGDVKSYVFGFNITGLRIQWKVSGNAGAPGALVEFCPMFDVSGEQRGGTADSN